MISFIVIGKNEGWKLKKCIESIQATIEGNAYSKYEIIYVDSGSTDNSVDMVSSIGKEIKIFVIHGHTNAAIARNIGASESTGETLFFIDGDMEIQSDFLPLVYKEEEGLRYDFVSGNWLNYHYDSWEDPTPVSKEKKREIEEDRFEYTCGGLFLIKRQLWNVVGGMKEKYNRSQDWDLGLKLAKKGTLLLRKKEILAIHHTSSPLKSTQSLLRLVFSGAKFYRAILIRDHFLNKYLWQHMIRTSYTFFLLWVVIILSFIIQSPIPLLLYVLMIFTRSFLKKQTAFKTLISTMILYVYYETILMFAIIFFWPPKKRYTYKNYDSK